jgi:hypothetical protein
MDNPEILTTLYKTQDEEKQQKTLHRKLQDEQHGPHQETGMNPWVRKG